MVIYLDLLILSTIVVNYLFIKTIAIIFHEKLSIIRVIISLVMSVLMLFLYLAPYQFYFIVRYFMGIIIGMIAFRKSDLKIKIIKIVIFYILNMMFIGCLVVFKVKNLLPLVLTIFFVIILYIVQSYQNVFSHTRYIYQVKLDKVTLKGYLDTGNLSTYQNKPIVFLKNKYFNQQFSYLNNISINGIFGQKMMDVYSGPTLYLNKKTYEVYYIFVNEINYDIILNNLMKGDKNAKIN